MVFINPSFFRNQKTIHSPYIKKNHSIKSKMYFQEMLTNYFETQKSYIGINYTASMQYVNILKICMFKSIGSNSIKIFKKYCIIKQ
jgi:hypothetical protein